MFLPLERDICQAQILTFGYNAKFLKAHSSPPVLDFAKDLLYEMKYAKDDNTEDLHNGEVCSLFPRTDMHFAYMEQVPLIFVAHSMGGLIVKEVSIITTWAAALLSSLICD